MFQKIRKINFIRALKLNKLKTPVIVGLAVTVFVAVNFFMSPISLRFDFSNGAAYTLSNSTKKLMQKLDGGITIKFFASSDLPTKVVPIKNAVVDLLNEYKKANSGKVTIKFLDPKKDQNALKDAQETGIPELQFSSLEKDKYAVSSSYFALAVNYKDKKEVLPQVTDIEGLEYNVTAMIYKLTRKETIKIGIIGKDLAYDPNSDDISTIKKVFQQQYDVEYIDLTSKSSLKEIDSSFKTVLVFDTNKKEYERKETDLITTYLYNKGKAIIFADGEWVGEGLSATPAKHNLDEVFNNFGMRLNKDLVLSTNAELVNFGNSMVQFMAPYPFFLKTNVFNPKVSYFSNVNQLTFPWASSVSLIKTETEPKEVVLTTNRSWDQKEASGSSFMLDPQSIPPPQSKDMKSYVLVAESKIKDGGSIMLVPTSRFILDRYLTKTSNNLEFILNVVNDYASDGALSGIHQRVVSFYPLPELADNVKDILKYANIFVLPLLFGLIGGIILFRRR